MRAHYEQLGVEIEPADFRDVLGVLSVHAVTFVETYHTEALPQISPNSPEYMSREILERFVYTSDFLERKVVTWRELIAQQDENNSVLAAKYNDQVVGFSHTTLNDTEGTIGALYILPDFQRRYIGQALIGGLMQRAGSKPVRLDVVGNTPAIDFYKHFGFTIVGALPPEDCPEMKPGKWLTLLAMERYGKDTTA